MTNKKLSPEDINLKEIQEIVDSYGLFGRVACGEYEGDCIFACIFTNGVRFWSRTIYIEEVDSPEEIKNMVEKLCQEAAAHPSTAEVQKKFNPKEQ